MNFTRVRLALLLTAGLALSASAAGLTLPKDRTADPVPPELARATGGTVAQYGRLLERVVADSSAEVRTFRGKVLPRFEALLVRMEGFVTEAGAKASLADAMRKERERYRGLASRRRDDFQDRAAAALNDFHGVVRRNAANFQGAYEVLVEREFRPDRDPIAAAYRDASGTIEVMWSTVLAEVDAIHARHAKTKR